MYRNQYGPPITTLTPFPLPETKTGVIDSSLTVVKGIGTDFTEEDIRKGDFLWNQAQGELRKIIGKSYSSEILNIDSPFTLDLAAAPLVVVKANQVKSVSLSNVGAAVGTIDGEIIAVLQTISFGRNESGVGGDEYIDPVIVDGTGTSIQTLKTK